MWKREKYNLYLTSQKKRVKEIREEKNDIIQILMLKKKIRVNIKAEKNYEHKNFSSKKNDVKF